MRLLLLVRFALCLGAGSALISACTGSQPTVALPGTASPNAQTSSTPDGAILYAASSTGDAIYAFSYPRGKPIGKIVPPKGTLSLEGICSDPNGNIYVTSLLKSSRSVVGYLYEYRRGGAHPINKWTLGGGDEPFGCSYDPTTGNLAVTSVSLGVTSGYLLVINPTSQNAKIYYDYNISNYYYCGYDGKGNLFLDGQGANPQLYFAELRKGDSAITNLALQRSISVSGMGQVQWDGHYITVQDLTASSIYRLKIAGTKANVAGTTRLSGWNGPTLSWIQGSSVIVPTGVSGATLVSWQYPGGGKPTKRVQGHPGLFSVTVGGGQ